MGRSKEPGKGAKAYKGDDTPAVVEAIAHALGVLAETFPRGLRERDTAGAGIHRLKAFFVSPLHA